MRGHGPSDRWTLAPKWWSPAFAGRGQPYASPMGILPSGVCRCWAHLAYRAQWFLAPKRLQRPLNFGGGLDLMGFDRSVLTGEVCVTTRAQSYIFPLPSNAIWRYCRANRSLDAWKRQMTISSRYMTLPPGTLRLNTCFSPLMRYSSDKEHCSSRDTVRQRIRSRPCLPNWRQHCLVCIFCLSLCPMSHGIWTARLLVGV